MEIQSIGNFLKCMKVLLIRSPIMEGYGVPTGPLLSPNESSSTGIGLLLIELLIKGIPWQSPKNPGCGQENELLSANCPIAGDNTHTTH